ncbi:PadR family transcriptional regulator [Rhodococcus sp. (in: high G+C Gram-positive bacteria)]|uniref:PadR family transcriptional regulator n=1 Tax=Rhodococcus sp. TaxID=1831 RepID=UPI00257E7C14|nr:PadR family transcriptional regulator [Rhodococcus sp. (in: high G+C Gram-positive bacteria)]MBQ9053053.1 PadR family transcriptional regulator [Rhodococcus sp. (in: high G+C Gram-positive bacteria)]
MSLRMAVLALLTARPMTGFDLMRQFDVSVGFLWNAPHTQIYPELKKLELAGLVEGTDMPRGQKGTKRQYRITDDGIAELRAMMNEIEEPRRERDPHRLKAAYMEWADPEAARAQLITHLEYFQAAEILYQQQHDDILARRIPLLQDRLKDVPADQQEAVIEFKAYAYAGLVSRARGEIEWAKTGLQLLDRFARKRADSDAVAEAVARKPGA